MEQAKVIPLPQYKECEICNGKGATIEGPIYIDGDLYMDEELFPCEECGGSGKIKVEGHEA